MDRFKEMPRTDASRAVLTKSITRKGASNDPGMLSHLMAAALENAPDEKRFNIAVVPSGILPQGVGLDELIRAAIRDNDKNLVQKNSFDPYEKGIARVEELKRLEGGAFTGPEISKRLGLSSAVLHRRRKEFRIVYWRDARGDFHYPKWQFNPVGALLPGTEDILQLFRSTDEWRIMGYFLYPKKRLSGMRPLDLLRAHQTNEVITHARAHAEQNTW